MCAPWFAIVWQPETWGMAASVLGSASGWLMILGCVMLALLPDVLIEMWRVVVIPTPLHVQMYHERERHKR